MSEQGDRRQARWGGDDGSPRRSRTRGGAGGAGSLVHRRGRLLTGPRRWLIGPRRLPMARAACLRARGGGPAAAQGVRGCCPIPVNRTPSTPPASAEVGCMSRTTGPVVARARTSPVRQEEADGGRRGGSAPEFRHVIDHGGRDQQRESSRARECSACGGRSAAGRAGAPAAAARAAALLARSAGGTQEAQQVVTIRSRPRPVADPELPVAIHRPDRVTGSANAASRGRGGSVARRTSAGSGW